MNDVASHIVQLGPLRRGTSAHAVLVRQAGLDTWLLLCHLVSDAVDVDIIPVVSLEGPNALLR